MLLFLGAGASINFGIPDTKGFIAIFEEDDSICSSAIYKKIKENIANESFDTEILMTILDDLSKPQEELLDSISPHTSKLLLQPGIEKEYFLTNGDIQVECHDILRKIKKLIRVRCLEKVREQRENIMKSYDLFFNSLQGLTSALQSQDSYGTIYSKMDIFTTNYDTCIETYFNIRKVETLKGVELKYGEEILNSSIFFENRHNIGLVKLHGSVDLFTKDKKIRCLIGAGASDVDSTTSMGEDYGEEFMIYPVESSGAVDEMQSPLIELLHYFKQRLNENLTWIIIGSTFRDMAVASIMNEVIMQKNEKHYPIVLHINPEATRINEYILKKGYGYLAKMIKPMDTEFINDDLVEKLLKIALR